MISGVRSGKTARHAARGVRPAGEAALELREKRSGSRLKR